LDLGDFGGDIEVTDDEGFVGFESVEKEIGTSIDFSERIGLKVCLDMFRFDVAGDSDIGKVTVRGISVTS